MNTRTDQARPKHPAGNKPPPPMGAGMGEPGDQRRPYEELTRSAVLLRAYHGHLLSLGRVAALRDSAKEVLSNEASPGQFMADVVDYFQRVRSVEMTAKYEMIFTFARDSLRTLHHDSYFRARPLDRALLQDVLDVYTIGVEKLASSRVGQPDSRAPLTSSSPLEDSLELDPDFLAGYPRSVQLHWFRVLSSLQSVLADFLADIDRDVSNIGCQHEDPPFVEAVRLRSAEARPILAEVYLVWRNSGDLIGIWDDIDGAQADHGWVPSWARTDGDAT